MKTRETKQKDLALLKESLENSKSAIIVSFKGASVAKDWELRKTIREAGAHYRVVKNTLARLAVKGTDFEQANDAFKGVSAIAWTDKDPVVLSKAISKFIKDNSDVYSFKSGVVDGKVIDFKQLGVIANLPSKEELIAKLLYVLNAQAQRLVTVINAVPRDLAIVIKQIGEKAPESRTQAAGPAPADQEAGAAVAAAEGSEATAEEAPAEAKAEDSTPDAGSGEKAE
ncbi:MAG: 50S ribosomal protein L10 [Pyrinomonadaceae bacterium]|jgi:large subunit ribosomal protein L10